MQIRKHALNTLGVKETPLVKERRELDVLREMSSSKRECMEVVAVKERREAEAEMLTEMRVGSFQMRVGSFQNLKSICSLRTWNWVHIIC